MACFARDIARQRHHRRRAEQADIDAGRGEFRGRGGDGQIATGDQLAAGGAGDALHGGDHRLRQIDDLLHHGAAGRHDVLEIGAAAVGVAAPRGQFLQIVAGAKRRTVGRQHHRADRLVGGDLGQAADSAPSNASDRLLRACRTIEHENGDVAIALAQQHGCGGFAGAGGGLGAHEFDPNSTSAPIVKRRASTWQGLKRRFDRMHCPSMTEAPG